MGSGAVIIATPCKNSALLPTQNPSLKLPIFFSSTAPASARLLRTRLPGVAIGWFVYDKTRSALDLGYLGLCQFLPLVVLIFVAGQAADRLNRRLIVLGCQWTEAVIAALLAVAAFTGHLRVPMIFAAVTVFGCVRAFEGPTLSSLLPALVPSGILARGTGGIVVGAGDGDYFRAVGGRAALRRWGEGAAGAGRRAVFNGGRVRCRDQSASARRGEASAGDAEIGVLRPGFCLAVARLFWA